MSEKLSAMLRTCSLAGLLMLSSCGGDGNAGTTGPGDAGGNSPPGSGLPKPKIVVQPMTSVNVGSNTGYFQDPYPIHTLQLGSNPGLPTFSGTNEQTISCAGEIKPECFTPASISLNPGPFTEQTAIAGSTINNFENLNIYQDNAGGWQMAVTAHLTKSGVTAWNVILHARPTNASSAIPTAWIADTLLIGSLDTSASDNYDGKYFEDSGILYLIYNKKIGADQDGVVAQPMNSAMEIAPASPTPLLGPEIGEGGYNSELAYGLNQSNPAKLVETGNITKINGKYVMTYSAGTYNRSDYKTGIAYSDTFLPAAGTYYGRVQRLNSNGVWGQANHAEILYILQSQLPEWPNYVADQVLAPGVPSIVQDHNGVYYLTFAGYDPHDAPLNDKGLFNGAHRRPYYIKLDVKISSTGTVSDASLRNW